MKRLGISSRVSWGVASLAIVVLSADAAAAEGARRDDAGQPPVIVASPAANQAGGKNAPEREACWWSPAYLTDYAVIAAGFTTALLMEVHGVPASSSVIGPSFDLAKPKAILTPSKTNRESIGKPYRDHETVSIGWPIGAGILLVASASILSSVGDGWFGFHQTVSGGLEAVANTWMVTNALKFSFGRLRPDFQSRVKRYYDCHEPHHGGLRCDGFDTETIEEASKVRDGRVSFPSGHSSISFAFATYTMLSLGGQYVWRPGSSVTARAIVIPTQLALLGAAAGVAASRVTDGRHNVSDVVTGGLIGTAFAHIAYWRRFDWHGRPRRLSPTDLQVTPGPGALGIGIAGNL